MPHADADCNTPGGLESSGSLSEHRDTTP
jgi:hypothetical protein